MYTGISLSLQEKSRSSRCRNTSMMVQHHLIVHISWNRLPAGTYQGKKDIFVHFSGGDGFMEKIQRSAFLHMSGYVKTVARIAGEHQTRLLQIAETGGVFCPVACFIQRGQQHCRRNRDDRYHDEEFDQGEFPPCSCGNGQDTVLFFHGTPLFLQENLRNSCFFFMQRLSSIQIPRCPPGMRVHRHSSRFSGVGPDCSSF